MKNYKRIIASSSALVLAVTALASCGSSATPVGRDTKVPTISVMTQQNNITSADQRSPVVQEIENYLGKKMGEKYNKEYDQVKIDFQWTPSSGYMEKVTAAMGANEYPKVMLVTDRSSSVIQNSKVGTFWDLTGKFEEKNADGSLKYPYLAQSNPVVNRNISVDGKLYGIYRARVIGRQGMIFRKDWTENLYKKGVIDFQVPDTVEDLDKMVRAYKDNDPDGNGKDDTYGMIITSFIDGPVGNLAIWCGSPNEWGYDDEAKMWKPWFMSEGYFKALTLIRDWYADGYVNKNMVSLDADKWDNEFLNGYGGIQIDVADRGRRNAGKMDDPDSVDIIGYVRTDRESDPKIWPTTGHMGYYVIPQPAVPDEADLEFILSVLDQCNDPYVVGLCNYGIEGIHYELNAEGMVVQKKADDGKANYKAEDYADLNQFSMGVADGPEYLRTLFATKAAEKVDKVQKDNEQYAVMNPMAPYTSKSFATSGTMMNAIFSEARTNYLVGKIDEAGYKQAVEDWMKMDGEKVMQEYAEAYEADPLNDLDGDGKADIPDEFKFKFRFGNVKED